MLRWVAACGSVHVSQCISHSVAVDAHAACVDTRAGGHQCAVNEQPQRHGVADQSGAGHQRVQSQPAGSDPIFCSAFITPAYADVEIATGRSESQEAEDLCTCSLMHLLTTGHTRWRLSQARLRVSRTLRFQALHSDCLLPHRAGCAGPHPAAAGAPAGSAAAGADAAGEPGGAGRADEGGSEDAPQCCTARR